MRNVTVDEFAFLCKISSHGLALLVVAWYVKSLRDGTLEGVDSGEDAVSPRGVRTGSTDVERDEVLAVDADLLVNFEAVLGDGPVCGGRGAGGEEEGEALAAEEAHGNSG